MAAPAPLVLGSLRDHPLAPTFAAEVHRIHRRYAGEVVASNRLCPFLKDIDTGFGVFCVMLDREPVVAGAVDAVRTAASAVVHVVYPLVTGPSSPFEKFAGQLAAALKKALPEAPVMATFHPLLTGDDTTPFRLVGLLRRAPDPFVQLIPEGLHAGGTVFAGATPAETAPGLATGRDPALANYAHLKTRGGLEALLVRMTDIRADRDRSYAPFLAELAPAPS